MRCEPIELGIASTAYRSRAKLPLSVAQGSSRSELGKSTSSAVFIDEAFADFTRIDAPNSGNPNHRPGRSLGRPRRRRRVSFQHRSAFQRLATGQ